MGQDGRLDARGRRRLDGDTGGGVPRMFPSITFLLALLTCRPGFYILSIRGANSRIDHQATSTLRAALEGIPPASDQPQVRL